jgi:hypothetical protein
MATVDARTLYKVAYMYARWAGHITALAVHAELQGSLIGIFVFLTQKFSARPHLPRAREVEVHGYHWAIDRADGTLDALVELLL